MRKRTLVTCALGIQVAETIAKELDRLVKSLPKDPAYAFRKRTFAAKAAEFVEGERADISWVTTKAVDHDNEVVDPAGLDLSLYQKNPVVLYNHEAAQPIGRAAWIKRVEDGVKAKTLYANRPDGWEGDWFPDAVFALVKQGVLKGKSIGFLPVKVRGATTEEKALYGERADTIIEKSVLLEFSAVSIPCNSEALVEAVSKGYSPSTLDRLGIKPPAPKPKRKRHGGPTLFAQILKEVNFDPNRIAQAVLDRLRGRV